MAHEVKAVAKLDSTQYKQGTDQMQKSTKKLGESLGSLKASYLAAAAASGAIIAKVVSSISAMIDSAAELKNLSDRMGVSVERAQDLQKAFRDVGQGNEVVETAFQKVSTAQTQVSDGNKDLIQAFADLQISEKEAATMDLDQMLQRVGTAYKESGEGATEYAAILKIFGETDAPKMVKALQNIGSSATDSSGKMTTETVDNLMKFKIFWVDFWDTMGNHAANVFSKIQKVAEDVFTYIMGGQKALDLLYQNRVNAEAESRQKAVEKKVLDKKVKSEAFDKKKLKEKVEREAQASKKIIDNIQAQAKEEARIREKAAADKQKALDKIKTDVEREIKFTVDVQGDSLSKVGLRVGGQANPNAQYQARALTIAEQTKEIISRTATLLSNIEKNTQDLSTGMSA